MHHRATGDLPNAIYVHQKHKSTGERASLVRMCVTCTHDGLPGGATHGARHNHGPRHVPLATEPDRTPTGEPMPRTPPLLALAVALTLTGCAIDVSDFDRPASPDRVRPTLDAWSDAGMVCRGPTEDNVPSGLLQWSCRGMLEGVEVSGNLDGDEKGVFGFQVVAPAATEPDAARDAFARLIDATPALEGLEPGIVAFVDSWPGLPVVGTFGDARVTAVADSTWRVLTVSPGPRRNVDDAAP